MAVAAVVLSVATTSCDDDDDDDDDNNTQTEVSEDGIVVGEKKLVGLDWKETNGKDEYEVAFTITYDSEGRLSTVLEKQSSGNITTKRYEWGDGIITEYETDSEKTDTCTYTLSGNLVTKVVGGNETQNYTYKSNRVATYESSDDWHSVLCTYTWDGDKIISSSELHSSDDDTQTYTITYSYSGKTCNGILPDWDGLEELHPELFGSRTNQLFDTMVSVDKNGSVYTSIYTYTFDEDGYVKTMTVVRTESNGSNGDSETYYYTYTWE